MRIGLFFVCLVFLVSCGDGADEPSVAKPDGVRPVPMDADRLSRIAMMEWEWFRIVPDRYAQVAGTVVDPFGDPVPEAEVSLLIFPMRQVCPPKRLFGTKTDGEGNFRLAEVPANAWVEIFHPSWAGHMVSAANLLSEEATEVRLRRGTPVSGTLALPDGTPVADWPIQGTDESPSWTQIVRTGPGGEFVFPQVPAGKMALNPLPGRYGGMAVVVDVVEGTPLDRDLVVREIPSVIGRILDGTTRRPIEGAAVLSLVDRQRVTLTDADGRFEVTGACQPGVVIKADGYAESGINLDPERTETQDVGEVLLSPGNRLFGRVLDTEGNPVGGARVTVFVGADKLGVPIFGPCTREDGTFAITWVPALPEDRALRLVAMAPDALASPGDAFKLPKEGVLRDLTVTLVRPSMLTLRIVDEAGQPWPGTSVQAARKAGAVDTLEDTFWPGAIALTAADGTVRLGGLGPGAHRLVIRAPHRARYSVPVDVPAEVSKDMGNITVPRGLRASGRILTIDGEPIERAEVTINRQGRPLFERLATDADGAFQLTGLTPGSLTIRVAMPGYETLVTRSDAGADPLEIRMRRTGALSLNVARPEGLDRPGRIAFVRVVDGVPEKPVMRALERGTDRLELTNFPSGRHWIRIEMDEWFGLGEIDIPEGGLAELEIPLERGGVLTGTVVAPDGSPVPGAGVEYAASPEWGLRGVPTDPGGHFLFPVVPPGEITVHTHPYGYPPLSTTIRIAAATEEEVALELSAGGRILVSVEDSEEKPVAGVRVMLAKESGEPARYWLENRMASGTGRDGTLNLTGIAPGVYILGILLDDESLEQRRIQVEEGQELAADFTIER